MTIRQSIAKLKEKIPVQNYLEHQGIEVKRNRARCLVHEGGNPKSLQINPESGKWRCHSCGQYGDVVDLAKAVEGHTETWEAVVSLSMSFNIELPKQPERWDKWAGEKGRRRKMLRDNLADSYRRRYFRVFYAEYLQTVEPELREGEAQHLWEGLHDLSVLCAEQRMAG